MPYSPAESHWHPEELRHLQSLLACEELRIVAKQGGGNSVVYCVATQDQKWALKSYPPYAPAERDRLAAECKVYQFLNQHAVPAVPLLKTHCMQKRWLVMDWIEGEIPSTYTDTDIQQAIQFIQAIHQLNTSPEATHLPEAAEACLSLTILLEQIQKRFKRLAALPNEPLLHAFLHTTFLPLFEQCQQEAIEGYKKNSMNPDAFLAKEQRSLIPADFGFHNSIRDAMLKLYFFDFDYFGWDDPVKLLADILWHPKMPLSSKQQQQFIEGIAAVYAADPLFLTRFQFTRPLFGLRWALILLNEFIPAFWQNRQHAGAFKGSQDEAKSIQLERAEVLLLKVNDHSSALFQQRLNSII